MEKLKPCPFCGGKAKLQEQIIAKGAWSVVCLNEKCGAHIFFYGAEWNKETNVRRWNRRAKMDGGEDCYIDMFRLCNKVARDIAERRKE